MNGKQLGMSLGIVLCLVTAIIVWMSRGYDKISEGGYEYALALISACNRQDLERVQMIVENARQANADGKLPDYDTRVLEQIGQQAIDGRWEQASANARKLLKSQVQVAPRLIQQAVG